MFDYQTQSNPITRLGTTEFDLVRLVTLGPFAIENVIPPKRISVSHVIFFLCYSLS